MIQTKHPVSFLAFALWGMTSVCCGKSRDFHRAAGSPSAEGDTAGPTTPAHTGTFLITDFGAVADGVTLNTDAIRKTIDSAGVVGGIVVVPTGVFLSGPLALPGNITLELKRGAVLKLRNDIAEFPAAGSAYLNFITATKVSHIRITGEGTIDGQGQPWWQAYDAGVLTKRRPQLIYIDQCSDVKISGIHTVNPPNTHFSLRGCKDVTIDSVTITAPADSHNTDGINISGNNILITRCNIRTGDDNIAINIGNFPSSDIRISHCTFGYGHGLSIGSYTTGGLDSLTVDSCTFNGTTSGIRMKTNRDRGGVVKNLSYSHIIMTGVKDPVYLSSYYPHEPDSPAIDPARAVTATTPVWKNITLSNISVTGARQAMIIWGLPEQAIENVNLTSIDIAAEKGMLIYNASGVVFNHCSVTAKSGDLVKQYNADVSGF